VAAFVNSLLYLHTPGDYTRVRRLHKEHLYLWSYVVSAALHFLTAPRLRARIVGQERETTSSTRSLSSIGRAGSISRKRIAQTGQNYGAWLRSG